MNIAKHSAIISVLFFFFKQKTANEIGTGDWSSDVCSSDLPCFAAGLAYYIAIKRAPEKAQLLKQLYEEEFDRAMSTDEDKASFRIRPFNSLR